MHPSQHSKTLIQKWHESNPTRLNQPKAHKANSHSLTLHLLNGDKRTYFYMYLVKAELKLLQTLNAILLRFNSEKVILKGYKLHTLYADIINKNQSDLYISNQRYTKQESTVKPVIIEASFEEKKP
jgi:hypothetical protein